MKRIETNSPEETRRAGRELAAALPPGSVLALTGDLGSGKTAFVKGVADCLGDGEQVTSPTYTLVNEYPGRIPLYHFDVYRLEQPDLSQCDWMDDYLFGEGICVVEWADRIRALLPRDTVWVTIAKNPARGETYREITIC